ncbi:hypothetical protein [Candidatus Poriferisodalis sp.]|uniref:hypothetical protein n=1 Tax=Candidatus Poriferisodalis sp. TaxID=3101277 RepID=UPI003B51C61D
MYERARAGLLDAADALGVHLDAVVLVGAQAVYTHTSETEFVVDEYTTDADLGPHGNSVAHRAKGLEAVLIDRGRRMIEALDPNDGRSIEMSVAGPGALLVAKVHKIANRSTVPDRLNDKDALDVLRLLQSVSTDDLCARLVSLRQDDLSKGVTDEAIAQLGSLFGSTDSIGVRMAVSAVGILEDPDFIASSMVALVGDLLDELAARPHQGASN